jgi:hypothetical protein
MNEIEQTILTAIEKGIDNYIESRKLLVPIFVKKNFSFKGTLKLHRKVIGRDLYKAPLNVLWSVPCLLVKISSKIFKKMGKKKVSQLLTDIPQGFQTDLQEEIKWLLYTELLELPYEQSGRLFLKDALFASILGQREISDLIETYLYEIKNKSHKPNFRPALERNLKEYVSSRVAVSDIASNIITMATSYFTFNQAAPGAFTAGNLAAVTIAQQIAISNFWLGAKLGALYYSIFPAVPSAGLLIASTGALITALALITSFIGIITDPVQTKLGIHKRRLVKFINMLRLELKGGGKSEYYVKDHYLARVFDIIDLLKMAAKSV